MKNLPDDSQLVMRHGPYGFLIPQSGPPGQIPSLGFTPFTGDEAHAVWESVSLIIQFPFADRLLTETPALSCWPGQMATQDANLLAESKACALGPVSATRYCAVRTLIPGISHSRSIAS